MLKLINSFGAIAPGKKSKMPFSCNKFHIFHIDEPIEPNLIEKSQTNVINFFFLLKMNSSNANTKLNLMLSYRDSNLFDSFVNIAKRSYMKISFYDIDVS